MKITRRNLKRLIEHFLNEEKSGKYVCPKCGHKHAKEPKNKCNNCGHAYDNKFQGKHWVKPNEKKNESIIPLVFEAIIKFTCPAATQNVELNTANRDRARNKNGHIKYGPLNIDEPGDYWKKIAKNWDTTEKAAKKSLCGNCVAFDVSPQMKECMPGEVEEDSDGGRLGYCWMHHFKCHSLRTCNTWARGGPITKNKTSLSFFKKNKEQALSKKPLRG